MNYETEIQRLLDKGYSEDRIVQYYQVNGFVGESFEKIMSTLNEILKAKYETCSKY